MTINLFAPPKSRIIGAIRRIFSMSELYKNVKNKALVEEKGPRGGKQVRCACCGSIAPWGDTNVDHIEAVIPTYMTANEMSYDEIISRMWCTQENLQVLCKKCHDEKTKEENKERKEFKKRAKNECSSR